jgi:hypothetical protein
MGINSFAMANRVEAAISKTIQVLGPIALGAGQTFPVSATDLWVTQATFYGYKALPANGVPTVNALNCGVGPFVAGVAKILDVIPPGGRVIYAPAGGTKFNLKDLAVSGAAADGVVVSFLQ